MHDINDLLDPRIMDAEWRLDNLYCIIDKYGKKIKFIRNWAQKKLWRERWFLNIILKSRQEGLSTFIAIVILDTCLWTPNTSAAIIDLSLVDAKKKLAKISFAYENLPDWIREHRKLTTDSKESMMWDNGSNVEVGTSHRGSTAQILHISELGKIAVRTPDKAEEIRSGALNVIAPGCFCFIESTAEGKAGMFFDMVQEARDRTEWTPLDFKLHFFNWHMSGINRLATDVDVQISQKDKEYFELIEHEENTTLSREQRIFYIKKRESQKDLMLREYPSTIDEAFDSVVDGSFYAKILNDAKKEGRITSVPYDESLRLITCWDLGMSDDMSVWFIQQNGREMRLIDYYSTNGEGFAHYADVLRQKGYYYDMAYMPHDIAVRSLSTGVSRLETAERLGIKPIERVPRAKNQEQVLDHIHLVRQFLKTCYIDEEKCAEGLKGLYDYAREWDSKLGVFKGTPLHNKASHAADSLRTGVVGIKVLGGIVYNDVYNDGLEMSLRSSQG